MKPKKVAAGLLGAGLVGWAVFGAWLWQATEIRKAPPAEALAAAAAVRDRFAGQPPWLARGDDGRFVRATAPGSAATADPPPGRPHRLHVLVWRAADRQLLRTEIPFWYLKLKEISIAYLLRRAGVDLAGLGLRPRDLERRGPGLVLDDASATGDLLVIWTD